MAVSRRELQLELVAIEGRLRRTFVAWALIAHSATSIVTSLLVLLLGLTLACPTGAGIRRRTLRHPIVMMGS